ncbi:NADPH:quinone reductase [Gracilibacillus orientalis]|uniref:NADPH:quinone reductase n=1 Tax=Gracilibacillus orientalis TaxID=334253 RepID=A0A1I4H8T8_9BACI|nr:zinc-binding dehydrogenase [Gracilibacillus orientalis]SFL37831.1 NADPH:quinone reductase [Gracilibacillus orientalis]
MIRAVVTDKFASGHLTIQKVVAPQAKLWEAIVEVRAFSLNRGEITNAKTQEEQIRPGWDFTGIVIEQARNGEGPRKGSRVVGLLPSGAWAEKVAVPVSFIAEIPDTVSYAQAATLPVAGLSALYTLRKGGMLLGKRILITGSTGGVGLFAHQLASLSGAFNVGIARTEEKANMVIEAGANEVIIGESITKPVEKFGPYHLVVDSVGGETLPPLLSQLIPGGVIVSVGYSASPIATFDLSKLAYVGGVSLYRFFLGEEVNRFSPKEGLKILGDLVAKGQLKPRIAVEAPWENIGTIAQQLIERKFSGKAVLLINGG